MSASTARNMKPSRRTPPRASKPIPWEPALTRISRTLVQQLAYNPTNYTNQFANDSVTPGGTNHFRLEKLPDYTDFTTLFDAYRIKKVRLTWIYSSNSSDQVAPATTSALPMLGWCIDQDDGAPLGSTPTSALAATSQYDSFQLHRLDRPLTMTVAPKLASSVYAQGSFSAFTEVPNSAWVDMTYPNAQYYGIKWFIDPAGNTTNLTLGTVTVIAKYYIEFKTPR